MTNLLRHFFFLLYFFVNVFVVNVCFAGSKIDSLQKVLLLNKEDGIQVRTLNSLAEELRNSNPDTSVFFAQRALELSMKLGDEEGVASAYLWMGTAQTNLGKYNEALKNLIEARKFYEELLSEKNENRNLKKLYARATNNLGLVYYNQGVYPDALKYYSEGLKIRQEINDSLGIAASYNNMGNVYDHLSNYPASLKCNFAALGIREKLQDKAGISQSYNNIGLIYVWQGNNAEALKNHFASLKIKKELGDKYEIAASYNNIGLVYWDMKQYDEALKNHAEALKLYMEVNSKTDIAISYSNIGIIYNSLGNYDGALKNHLASLRIKEELGEMKGIASSNINIGNVYGNTKNFSEAIRYLKNGLELSQKFGFKDGVKEAYGGLSEIYKELKDYENAYLNFKLYSQTKDSIFNEESSKQIAEMQTKYETEKKEQQITLLNKDKELQDAQLNRQKIIIWSVIGGLLVVLILSMFIFRERRKSEKLLLNILPVETANELKSKGKASPKQYKNVTVMFTDFKGFTNIAEKLSAEELVSELDFLFRKFDEIISKYPIEKIKTIGDAYMCAGGLPAENSTNAMDVVSAAIEIQTWMITQKVQWPLRIGIHTGPVTAGVVGYKKFAFDIWGDAVNTAARMESSGEPGKINISGATYEVLKSFSKFKFIQRGKIAAKNKGEIEMYFVDGVNA